MEYIAGSRLSIKEISGRLGFAQLSHFSAAFKVVHISHYISLSGNVDQDIWDQMDQEMDDGQPGSGRLQSEGVDHAYFLDQ